MKNKILYESKTLPIAFYFLRLLFCTEIRKSPIMEKPFLKSDVKMLSNEVAEMRIYSEIGGWGVNGHYFAEDMQSLINWGVKKIKILINSPGGSIMHGLSIVGEIFRINQEVKGVTVETCVVGCAYSMASVIAVCGKNPSAYDYANFMMHNPFIPGDEYESLEESDRKMVDAMTETILTIYENRTKKNREQLREMLDAETWFNPTQALEAGFIDKIISTTKPATAPPMPENKKDNVALFNWYRLVNAVPLEVQDKPTGQPPQNNNPVDTAQANEEPPATVPTTNHTQNSEDTMDKNRIIKILNLPANASDEDIYSAIADRQSSHVTAEEYRQRTENALAELAEYSEKFKAMEAREAEAVVDAAIAEKKIGKEAREMWIDLAKTNPDKVKQTLTNMRPMHPNLANRGKNIDERSEWDFDTWAKNDKDGLKEMQDTDPERYASLRNAKFNKNKKSKI